MKIPAIRSKIGDWTYYISRMKFSEVSDYVSKINQELHKSETLRDEIQRAISDNYLSIKDYILNNEERFLGSLVLAVYDGNPDWIEANIEYDDKEFFEMGFLQLSGNEKIFPVDGQHRVEGIKAALEENTNLADEVIPVVLIGHKTSNEGMQRTRRLFTTLNRYAKPVKLDDIIALDEDDIVAITTRSLIEDYPLFMDGRVVRAKQKGISESNKTAFTSIISLYQTNLELFKCFYQREELGKPTKKNVSNYLKTRPSDTMINGFYNYLVEFWDCLISEIEVVERFRDRDGDSLEYLRNSDTGGNMLFRPIGLESLVKAVSMVSQKTDEDVKSLLVEVIGKIDLNLSNELWKNILWNPESKRMIMNGPLARDIIAYSVCKGCLTDKRVSSISNSIKSLWSLDVDATEQDILSIMESHFK